jgi:pentatricopeptide repeat protein
MVLPLGRQRLSAATRLLCRRNHPSLINPTLPITSPNHFPRENHNHGRLAILPFSTRADTESAAVAPSINQAGVNVGSVDPDQRPLSDELGDLSKRKHFWTLNELNQRTEKLIAVISSPTSEDRKQLSEHDCFNVLEAWMEFAKDGQGIQAAIKAQTLLDQMEKASFIVNTKTSFYEVVLQAYAVSRGLEPAAEAAQKLLERMLSRCRTYHENRQGKPPPEPMVKTFNIVNNCWAKSDTLQAGQRAEQVYAAMQAWGKECKGLGLGSPYHGCLPNSRSLNGVIIAWSKCRHAQAPERAMAILNRALEEQRLEVPDAVLPNVVTFNTVIDTWAQSDRGRKGAAKAEEILQLIIHWSQEKSMKGGVLVPDTRSYTMVLNAWARCERREQTGDAAKRAQDILFSMIHSYRDGVDVKPNLVSFTTCIAAWARCKDENAPEKAERLLDTLIELYKESGDKDFEPTVEAGNAVITAWARAYRLDSTERAILTFEKLKNFAEPDQITYNAVLSAYSKAGMGRKATEMLEWMEEISETDDGRKLQPDIISYNSVLAALAKDPEAGSNERAEALLERMERLSKSGKTYARPNKISFTTVIDAWSRWEIEGQALKAYALVTKMIKKYEAGDHSMKPDVFVFSVLMKACGRTRGVLKDKHNALSMAFDAMKVLETTEFGPPNHIAFLTLMRAVKQLLRHEPERAKILASVFERCAKGGYVANQVIAEAQESRELEFVIKQLHPNWIRNVPSRDRPFIGKAK